MINGKTILAVIPARGGSKRVPRKNLKPFRGKPLLLWSIQAAMQSKYIDRLIVSTEDKEIADLAEQFVQVSIRPDELARDDTSSEDVLRHVLHTFPSDWVVLIQPTSPLVLPEDIDGTIERAQMGLGCISVGFDRRTNGAVYVATPEWLSKHDFSHQGLMKYVMPEERSLDINEEADFLK